MTWLEALFNVLPTSPINDSLYSSYAHGEHSAKFCEAASFLSMKPSDLTNLIFFEFGVWRGFSAMTFSKVVSMFFKRPLFNCVSDIILGCARKQMIGVNTCWIVSSGAIVADKRFLIQESMYGTAKEIPGPSMGVYFPIGGDHSISGLGFASVPNPTAIWGQIHALHKCRDRIGKLINEVFGLSLCNKHLELSPYLG